MSRWDVGPEVVAGCESLRRGRGQRARRELATKEILNVNEDRKHHHQAATRTRQGIRTDRGVQNEPSDRHPHLEIARWPDFLRYLNPDTPRMTPIEQRREEKGRLRAVEHQVEPSLMMLPVFRPESLQGTEEKMAVANARIGRPRLRLSKAKA